MWLKQISQKKISPFVPKYSKKKNGKQQEITNKYPRKVENN